MNLPTNWEAALLRIAESPTSILLEAIYCHSPANFRTREAVKSRYKRPQLIVECFDLWLSGINPVSNCPKVSEGTIYRRPKP